ncbi:MAG: hypothetical protein KDD50_04900 [Bdellovibrionales bacterium]|nr:hypothetical protein [Bdellovibrionales bacterium]
MTRVFLKFFFLTSTIILLISFQNCSHQFENTALSLENSQISNEESQQEELQNQASNIVLINLQIPEEQKTQFSQLMGYTLTSIDVDVDSGQISAETKTPYCLSAHLLSDLKLLLHEAKICKGNLDEELPQNQLCTLYYQAPYARLVFENRDEISMGERPNGCRRGPDFCEENFQKAFKSKIHQLLAHINRCGAT